MAISSNSCPGTTTSGATRLAASICCGSWQSKGCSCRGSLLHPGRPRSAPTRPMAKLSIHDLDLVRKRVFVRVDFNVPMKDGRIADDTRIRASLPTIEFAMAHGATVVLASHLGRPKGKPSPQLSLRPVAASLSEMLGKPVAFADDCVGAAARKVVDEVYAKGGGIVLLENLRFHPEEEKNDPEFAKSLASL